MNAENENVLSMAQTVQAFYVANQAEADSALPALAAQMAELDTRVTQILLNAAEADQDISGYAVEKQELRDILTNATVQVGNACATYYTLAVPSRSLRERVDWAKSELNRKRDAELYVAAIKTWQIADPIKANLTVYGATSANVDEMNTALAAYLDFIQNPQQMASDRGALKEDEDKMIFNLRKFFSDILDQLFEPIAISNSLLYGKYKGARNIIDLPGGGGNPPYIVQSVLLPTVRLNVPLPTAEVSVLPGTPIKLFNLGPQAGLMMNFYFTNENAGEEVAGSIVQEVVAGSHLTVAASALGYDPDAGRTFLTVHNDSPEDQGYKIQIGGL